MYYKYNQNVSFDICGTYNPGYSVVTLSGSTLILDDNQSHLYQGKKMNNDKSSMQKLEMPLERGGNCFTEQGN
jgi:hypothetical protein